MVETTVAHAVTKPIINYSNGIRLFVAINELLLLYHCHLLLFLITTKKAQDSINHNQLLRHWVIPGINLLL